MRGSRAGSRWRDKTGSTHRSEVNMSQIRKSVAGALLAASLISIAACSPTPTRESTGEYVDDSGITARVKTALLNDSGIREASAITVETYRGVVQLSGFVDTPEMAQKAVSSAQKVNGVRSVKNDIRIKPAQ